MKVHHDEGLAIRIGPKPCTCLREKAGEASAGECIGQPLSRERILLLDADFVLWTEGNTVMGAMRVHNRSGVVRDPGMCRSSLFGNREISAAGRKARGGKARSRSRR